MIDNEEIKFRLSQPLDVKIKMSVERIREFYNHHDGHVSVSFSGGLDSTVLLHLVRSVYPDVVGVFADTGLEFPEIREFALNQDNVQVVKPIKNFRTVIREYGYPVVSKRQAQYIHEARTGGPGSYVYQLRSTGTKKDGSFLRMACISKKWLSLIDAPFKISHKCCHFLKTGPLKKAEKVHGAPFVGVRIGESKQREKSYQSFGCNKLEGRSRSWPLSFWSDKDIKQYIKMHDLRYSKLYDMGYTRSGCVFCLFGIHLEPLASCLNCETKLSGKKGLSALEKNKCPKCKSNLIWPEKNRIQRLAVTHPKLYKYCIEQLRLDIPLDFIRVDYTPMKKTLPGLDW